MKVEKVVKPPQNPVVSRSLDDGDIHPPVTGSEEKKPMSRHPSTLTVNVPRGNGVVNTAAIPFDTRKRSPPPKKLPKPTIRKSLIINI